MSPQQPQAILVLPHLRIQNANAIGSPLTHGFPSITAFTGVMWALQRKLAQAGVPMVFFMCTDMRAQATDLLFCGQQAEEIVRSAFHVETKDGKAVLPGVVSRKKQLIPPLMAALQALQA